MTNRVLGFHTWTAQEFLDVMNDATGNTYRLAKTIDLVISGPCSETFGAKEAGRMTTLIRESKAETVLVFPGCCDQYEAKVLPNILGVTYIRPEEINMAAEFPERAIALKLAKSLLVMEVFSVEARDASGKK